MVEQALADFSISHELDSCALRYFNACGANPEGELGEVHDPGPHQEAGDGIVLTDFHRPKAAFRQHAGQCHHAAAGLLKGLERSDVHIRHAISTGQKKRLLAHVLAGPAHTAYGLGVDSGIDQRHLPGLAGIGPTAAGVDPGSSDDWTAPDPCRYSMQRWHERALF